MICYTTKVPIVYRLQTESYGKLIGAASVAPTQDECVSSTDEIGPGQKVVA